MKTGENRKCKIFRNNSLCVMDKKKEGAPGEMENEKEDYGVGAGG